MSRRDLVTRSVLQSLYKTFTPAAKDRNVFGVAGFSGDYPSPADLENSIIVGTPDNPTVEGDFNIQDSEAMAYPTQHIYYSTGSGPLGRVDPYLFWLRYMFDSDEETSRTGWQTINASYNNYESSVPQGYARPVCTLFARLSLRGVSVLFASGDFGPWITTVGRTTSRDPDISADLSGGGCSDYLLRRDYQDEVVPTFFENLGDEYRGLYKRVQEANRSAQEITHREEKCEVDQEAGGYGRRAKVPAIDWAT
ncbi:peptidase S8/S53 domain-containing protein [Lactarius akahatsu]|uniref:Peptidase S8/S53 domain-containing protein n=1 Tax=Lactarius akahatsu TaxID=416441 RepID=A0AAD4LJX3_9AGAM|nr:peptidase S8/S53 domain-containing protein [Lactarius akahatsu]